MTVLVAVTDSAEGDVALRAAAAEATLRDTGLLVLVVAWPTSGSTVQDTCENVS